MPITRAERRIPKDPAPVLAAGALPGRGGDVQVRSPEGRLSRDLDSDTAPGALSSEDRRAYTDNIIEDGLLLVGLGCRAAVRRPALR
jgi:hypothetical protein